MLCHIWYSIFLLYGQKIIGQYKFKEVIGMKYIFAVFLIAAFFATGCSSGTGRYFDDAVKSTENKTGADSTGSADDLNGMNGMNGTAGNMYADGLTGVNGVEAIYGTDGGAAGANGSLAGATNTGRSY